MRSNGKIAIKATHLSKMFKIYGKPSDIFWEFVTRKIKYREFWALKDVCFELKRGEMVGIMGRNGAGKSTFLKILTGTLDKTEGELFVDGIVSSILELGTGFHPEYSGRENIYMGGLCLGLSRTEIDRKVEWVIDFSELRDFISQPFKTYSSGMQARLTFSTAICVDPDILIVDEALAVGDAKFQAKCFDQLRRFRENGGTVLFVSHDINTVNAFCDRAFLLEQGQIVEEGKPKYVTQCYYRLLFGGETARESESSEVSVSNLETSETEAELSEGTQHGSKKVQRKEGTSKSEGQERGTENESEGMHYGNGKARILEYGILDKIGKRVKRLTSRELYVFYLRAMFNVDMDRYSAGFHIRDSRGVDIFGATTQSMNVSVPMSKKGEIIECSLRVTMWLTNGTFFLTAGVAEEDGTQCDSRLDGLVFEVAPREGIFSSSVVDLNGFLAVNSVKKNDTAFLK